MEIGLLLALVALVALVSFSVLFPAASAQSGTRRRDYRRSGCASEDPFHAVSIRPAQTFCNGVDQIREIRFLSDNAPPLPLPECGHASCRCRYVHHPDRRSGARDRRLRQAADAAGQDDQNRDNRRRSPGRRASDLEFA